MCLDLSSRVVYEALASASEVVYAVLSGELHTSLTLIWLRYHESHHDHLVTCHVSAIQN